MNHVNVEELKKKFMTLFGDEPLLVKSPGRVNIIGEHTDYNDGYVLPAAIDKAAYIAISARNDEQVHLFAEAFPSLLTFSLTDLQPVAGNWTNYVLGVVDQLQKNQKPVKGFNLLLVSDVPMGAGLSSSAAIECATIMALNELFRLQLEKQEMVSMAQQAEHHFAGVKCGIMDQFASMFGKKDHAIKLDCRSLEYEYVPLIMKDVKILLLNTNVKHSLASSEYNTRRSQCEEGVSLVQRKYPDVKSLRDVSEAMLQEMVAPRDETVYRRCHYVVEENQRLLEGCEDLRNGNIAALGKKMFLTHTGLSKDYAVSCPELDFLVKEAEKNPAVLGARMMGGGFGGCTINLVHENEIDSWVAELAPAYAAHTGLSLSSYIMSVQNGTMVM